MEAKKLIKVLKADGWKQVRQNGSHAQFRKAGNSHVVTVPVHPGKEVSLNVLKDIERKTGLMLRTSR
ncbi:MAG: type II toxin-antitoxin system HicA family toxin [Solobacterium sp.]|nr:type II toxin-antitoxin system HicA family toxin [Solobacterium sp.]